MMQNVTLVSMKNITSVILICLLCSLAPVISAAELITAKTPKLVIVTIDGLRWQEAFGGADEKLLNNKDLVSNIDNLTARFWNTDKQERKNRLMPFLNNVIGKNGVIIGDRNNDSEMSLTNKQHFSFPGYNEIFTGKVDDNLTSNAKILNPNITFLEWLNKQVGFENEIAIFSGWDVFPFIFNRERSGLFINAGFENMPLLETHSQNPQAQDAAAQIKLMNQLQAEIPSPWETVRHDALTYGFAKLYLQVKQPKVLVINLGETDDFAHDGKYDAYLDSAKQTDDYLRDLWTTLQNMPAYKNNTNMIIITDHGRGNDAIDWRHHASKQAVQNYMTALSDFEGGIVGSEHIWFAAMGPNIKSQGLLKTTTELSQTQFAATALALLGIEVSSYDIAAASSLKGIINE
ncbi:MAG: hypothetical protein ACI97K_000789 [Glaciecola sp.]|jgi:hypothetical protein